MKVQKYKCATAQTVGASAGMRNILVVLCGDADEGDGHGDFGLLLLCGLWWRLLLRSEGVFVCS